MTIEEMERLRKEKGFTYRQISDGSDVALGTVQKIFGKTTTSPRYDTMQKLERFFVEEGSSYGASRTDRRGGCRIRRIDLDRQGRYTVDDYLKWPEDDRIELIDGVIYDMAAPSFSHQIVLNYISTQISSQIYRKKGGCVPVCAPTDVQIDRDDRTVVQPDFMVICDKSKIDQKRVYGVPDFIVEILSPSSRRKDTFIKQKSRYR